MSKKHKKNKLQPKVFTQARTQGDPKKIQLPVIQFDCSKAVPSLCKGDCCGVIPIDTVIWMAFKEKRAQDPIRTEYIGPTVFPITKDFKCCFLNENFQCNIYDYRPQVCRDYGKLEDLQCKFINQAGDLRTEAEQNEIDNLIKVQTEQTIKNLRGL